VHNAQLRQVVAPKSVDHLSFFLDVAGNDACEHINTWEIMWI